jgi:sugar phosphate isomerase/epimerase
MSANPAPQPVALELGVDSLCWNKQIAAGAMSLDDVVIEGYRLGAKWLRLHKNHLPEGHGSGELEAIGRRAIEGGQRIVWSGDGLGWARDGVRAGVEHATAEIEKAARAGATVVQFYASWFRFDDDILAGGVRPQIDYLGEVLREVVSTVADAGLVLALENHSNLTSTEMVELMDGVGSEHVRIYLDVANPFPVAEPVVPAVARMAPYTVAIDVKDIIIRSRWASREWHRKGYDAIYTWPGRGLLPWQEIWHALGAGLSLPAVPLVLEGLDESDEPAVSAEAAVRFMEGLTGPRLTRLETVA